MTHERREVERPHAPVDDRRSRGPQAGRNANEQRLKSVIDFRGRMICALSTEDCRPATPILSVPNRHRDHYMLWDLRKGCASPEIDDDELSPRARGFAGRTAVARHERFTCAQPIHHGGERGEATRAGPRSCWRFKIARYCAFAARTVTRVAKWLVESTVVGFGKCSGQRAAPQCCRTPRAQRSGFRRIDESSCIDENSCGVHVEGDHTHGSSRAAAAARRVRSATHRGRDSCAT